MTTNRKALNLSFLCSFGVMVAAGYVIYAASEWSWRTSLFPIILAVPLLALALIEMILSIFAVEDEAESLSFPPLTGQFST